MAALLEKEFRHLSRLMRVQASFTTATTDDGQGFFFDMIVTGAQFARNLTVDLMPVAFFTRQGCDVIFRGRANIHDPSPAGAAEIKLYEFDGSRPRKYKGSIMLQYWHDLCFFTYTTFRPIRDHIASVAMHASTLSKTALTVKAHVIFGHASGRRVHNMFSQHGKGKEIFADLPCKCPICNETKSEMPSRRKFEQCHVSSTQAQGDYWIPPADTGLAEAMHHLREMDKYETLLPVPAEDLANLPMPHHTALHYRSGIPSAQRHSTRPRQYWHADTIPLGSKTWNNMKHALILVDDYSRMTFVYLMKAKTQHTVAV
jgi:hypothetical protein